MSNVQVIRSNKRKSISIQIMPDTTIRISVPSFLSEAKIDKILQEKKDWIQEQQQLIQLRNQERKASSNDTYFYLGTAYALEIRSNQQAIVELGDKLYLGIANNKSATIYIKSWYKQQARKIITERVHFSSRLSGLTYNSITITEAKTRWGSCSSDRNLFFNWKLIMAPIEVIDYVVAHELSHLVEPNHSRRFWEQVRKISPLYRQYRTWLKRYGHTLTIGGE